MTRWFIPLLLCFAVATAFAGLRLCNKCGHENNDNAVTCKHCAAELPARPGSADAKNVAPSTVPEDPRASYMDGKIIRDEIREAKEVAEKKQDPEVAVLVLKNAAVLDLLTQPGKSHRSGEIRSLMDKYNALASSLTGKCTMCNGTGKGVMKVTLDTGEIVEREVHGKSCPKCKGTGKSQVRGTIDDLKLRMGATGRRYSMLQQSRRMLPVGGAWVPADFEVKLTIRQSAILKTATAAPCRDCLGLGCMNCTKCKGSGEIRCTNSDCEAGVIAKEQTTDLTKLKVNKTSECTICKATGKVACPDCSRGSILCRRCNGSGERPVCADCSGKGLAACKKCSGTGKFKELDCPNCRGTGTAACPKCKGDGRKG